MIWISYSLIGLFCFIGGGTGAALLAIGIIDDQSTDELRRGLILVGVAAALTYLGTMI
jgi:hypothetical protein